MMFLPFLWFILITLAIVFALPRILDAILYYMDQRSKIWMKEVEMEQRKFDIQKEQYKLQQMQQQRRPIK